MRRNSHRVNRGMDVNPEPLHEAGHFALMARGSDSLASRQRIGEIATVLKCSASEWRGLGFDDTPQIFVHTLSPTDRIACTTITVIGAPSLIGACTKELTAEGGAVATRAMVLGLCTDSRVRESGHSRFVLWEEIMRGRRCDLSAAGAGKSTMNGFVLPSWANTRLN
jgi:hypothetical protein